MRLPRGRQGGARVLELWSCKRKYRLLGHWGGGGCHWDGGRWVGWQGGVQRLDFHIFAIANIILAYCSKGNNKSFADYQSLQVVAPTIHTSYNIFLQFAKMPIFEKNMPLPTLSKFSLSRAACNHSQPNSGWIHASFKNVRNSWWKNLKIIFVLIIKVCSCVLCP